jgi:L-lactate dehydrogenase complex protein LldG
MPEGMQARFCERVADYRAEIEVVPAADVPRAIAKALAGFGARRVAIAAGLPPLWRVPEPDADFEVVRDDPDHPLDIDGLQSLDAVVTGSAVGIAETGTVVLDGSPACGRRALTLVPDAHVCVVAAADIVDDVPAALTRLRPTAPLTWISGPSATSDIELSRVEGVHGPRRLHVLVVVD